jgi:hypothetical protein
MSVAEVAERELEKVKDEDDDADDLVGAVVLLAL